MSKADGLPCTLDEELEDDYFQLVEGEEQVEDVGQSSHQEFGRTVKKAILIIGDSLKALCASGSSTDGLDDTTAPSVDGNVEIVVPTVEMKFQSTKEVYEFYRVYAHQVGFPIQIESTKKGVDGKMRYYYLECSRSGMRKSQLTNPNNARATGKTGCKARIRIVSDVLRIWRINKKTLTSTPQTTQVQQLPSSVIHMVRQHPPLLYRNVQGSVFHPSIFQMHSCAPLPLSIHGTMIDQGQMTLGAHLNGDGGATTGREIPMSTVNWDGNSSHQN